MGLRLFGCFKSMVVGVSERIGGVVGRGGSGHGGRAWSRASVVGKRSVDEGGHRGRAETAVQP